MSPEEGLWIFFRQTGLAVAGISGGLLVSGGVFTVLMSVEMCIRDRYVLETKDYGGWISGDPEDEYWVQTLETGKYTSCQNYFYNPFLKLSGCIECMKKELPDMKWLPYYSLAVFGGGCELENAGLSDGERKIIYLKQLSYTMYGMIRSSRKFLSRQVIDEIYDRLQGRETTETGLDKSPRLDYSKNRSDGRKAVSG